MNRHALSVPRCHGQPMTIRRSDHESTLCECLFCGREDVAERDERSWIQEQTDQEARP